MFFLNSISCLGRGEIRGYIRKDETGRPLSTARSGGCVVCRIGMSWVHIHGFSSTTGFEHSIAMGEEGGAKKKTKGGSLFCIYTLLYVLSLGY